MNKKITKNHIKGTPLEPEYNVSKVRAITDREAEERARNDPDSPIVDPKFLKRIMKDKV